MIASGMLVAVALAQAAPKPVSDALPPDLSAQWKKCVQTDPAVTAVPALVAACEVLLARPEPNGRQRALAYYWRAIARSRLADPAPVIADLDRALAVPDVPARERAMMMVARGDVRKFQKRPADARADYARALAIAPGDPAALYARALLAFDEKRYGDARADLTAADGGDLTPALHAKLHVLRGAAFAQTKEFAAALADYNRAVAIAPKDADARYMRAVFYSDQNNYEPALADYVATTELAPRFAGGFNGVCWKLAADLKREFDRARTACDTAVRLDPKDPNIQDSAGLVALQQKRWQDAWHHYDAASRTNPKYASYLYGRGIAALRLGRTAAGNADIAAAVKADPAAAGNYARYGQKP